MNEQLIPDFVKKRVEAKQAAEYAAKLKTANEALSSAIIRFNGPAFWKQLLKELYIAVLSLPNLGIKASVIDLRPTHPVSAVRIYLIRESHLPAQTYADVFYDAPGVNRIRCVPLDEEPYSLNLRVWPEHNNSLLASNGCPPMNAEQAAHHIVELLIKQIGE